MRCTIKFAGPKAALPRVLPRVLPTEYEVFRRITMVQTCLVPSFIRNRRKRLSSYPNEVDQIRRTNRGG
ncbi:MAG: hypothetical protein A4E48_00256 [Methanosaeta sp. PtaU1.Bin060]|nr:MAG: hypothetical protein A4E48_00256 [Methanosaeta sp. PtaU1.Bin060]